MENILAAMGIGMVVVVAMLVLAFATRLLYVAAVFLYRLIARSIGSYSKPHRQ